jgi:hypothetical protein
MAALQQPHMDVYVVPDIAVQFEAALPATAPEPIVPMVGIDAPPDPPRDILRWHTAGASGHCEEGRETGPQAEPRARSASQG